MKFPAFLLLPLVGFAVLSASSHDKENTANPASREPSKSSRLERAPVPAATQTARLTVTYGQLPLHFEPNLGQADSQVRFVTRSGGMNMFLTATEWVMVLNDQIPKLRPGADPPHKERAMVRMKLLGSERPQEIAGQHKLPGISNYFIGNDPQKWVTNVPHYARVTYTGVYPGVDVTYYGNGQRLEYDFVVAPGASAGAIRLAYEGVDALRLDSAGDLIFRTAAGELRQLRPRVYQEIGGRRLKVAAQYRLEGQQVSFLLAPHDSSAPVVIDPVLIYYKILGGSSYDEVFDIAVDSSGAAYLTGYTSSGDFPSVNPPPGQGTGTTRVINAFVAKLNQAGDALVYSTYLGDFWDLGLSIAVDSSGCAYATGYTLSGLFPTMSPFQKDLRGFPYPDAFVTKLNPAGNALIYSTFLGGSGWDSGFGIAVDGQGRAYVTGETESPDFPTQNPYQAYRGIPSAFVTRLDPAGNTLSYSTYLGGSQGTGVVWQQCNRGVRNSLFKTTSAMGCSIVVDSADSAYVTGMTVSPDFPMLNAYLGHRGGVDAFVTKLDAAGNTLAYSTYLGGSGDDSGNGIAIDSSGNAYVTGVTTSGDFPLLNAYQTSSSSAIDAFVTKVGTAGNSLIYSTRLGGDGISGGMGIAVDSNGSAYVTGGTVSSNFPALNPVSGNCFGSPFLVKFQATGNSLAYATCLPRFGGGPYGPGLVNPAGFGVAVDQTGSAYVGGARGYDDEVNDGFIAKVAETQTFALTLAASPFQGGSVSGGGSYAAGTIAPIAATANPGYAFQYFSGDVSGSTNPQTLIMNGPRNVVANFANSAPLVSAQVIGKAGPPEARAWRTQLTNAGLGLAVNAQITGLSFRQVGGIQCTQMPTVRSTLPLSVGDLTPLSGSGSAALVVDFFGCAANARFSVTIEFQANGGGYTGLTVLNNQFR